MPPPTPTLDDRTPAKLCVLASGSSGNCSVLVRQTPRGPRGTLIDAGLSPRRTRRLLVEHGVALHQIDDVVLTHLDSDHFHPGWMRELDREVGDLRPTLRLHRSHLRRLERLGNPPRRVEAFDDEIEFDGGRASCVVLSHDELGVAAFRFDVGDAGASLGFATDLGRPTDDLVVCLHGVSTLAIESNYCPVMQRNSARPAFLKARIMGGAGHLSNQQCAHAVRRIGPRRRVVLLHLSRQCNTPELAAAEHAGASYDLTVSDQYRPTGWVPVPVPAPGSAPPAPPVRVETLPLFPAERRSAIGSRSR
ncbi:MAG: MBL fold metallo-hydrolase [Phycisphaerales bacterium JB059]